MKTALLAILALSLTGCYTQTDIKRTVQHQDGTIETYENRSHGYNYNPNYTGHWDSYSNQTMRWNGGFGGAPYPPPQQQSLVPNNGFGQYSINY